MLFGEDLAALVADINAVERTLRAEHPEIRWLFFEPEDEA